MSDHTDATASPVELAAELLSNAWRTVRTVYYADTVSWRVLKSGGLLFFGFFLWAGGNLLRSYWSGLGVLRYVTAYGFVLLLYGPVHHAVVIPLALRWRRSGEPRKIRVGRWLPNAGLAVFLVVVVVLGTFPGLVGPMTLDFDATGGDAGPDVNPDLLCTKSADDGETVVHCHLTEAEGVSAVTVESGGERLSSDDGPPFEFTVRASEMNEAVGQRQFQVVLRDEDGEVIRRYTRTVETIETAD